MFRKNRICRLIRCARERIITVFADGGKPSSPRCSRVPINSDNFDYLLCGVLSFFLFFSASLLVDKIECEPIAGDRTGYLTLHRDVVRVLRASCLPFKKPRFTSGLMNDSWLINNCQAGPESTCTLISAKYLLFRRMPLYTGAIVRKSLRRTDFQERDETQRVYLPPLSTSFVRGDFPSLQSTLYFPCRFVVPRSLYLSR